MQNIAVGYGKAVFEHRSASVMALFLSSPFKTEFAGRVFKRTNYSRQAVGRTQVEGELHSETLEVPDNSLLVVQVSHNYRGRREADGAILLRTRQTAALLQITARIPHDASRSILQSHDFTCFFGRADILSANEASELFGIRFKNGWIKNYLDEDEIDECFSSIQEVLPEIEAAPVVEVAETRQGNRIVITSPQLKRRVRVRNPKG
jgi:hypothetical protein